MTSRDFCYWLQGFFEIQAAHEQEHYHLLSSSQQEMIKRHLNMVFEHEIDPSIDNGNVIKKEKLDQIHSDFFNRPPGVRC